THRRRRRNLFVTFVSARLALSTSPYFLSKLTAVSTSSVTEKPDSFTESDSISGSASLSSFNAFSSVQLLDSSAKHSAAASGSSIVASMVLRRGDHFVHQLGMFLARMT